MHVQSYANVTFVPLEACWATDGCPLTRNKNNKNNKKHMISFLFYCFAPLLGGELKTIKTIKNICFIVFIAPFDFIVFFVGRLASCP